MAETGNIGRVRVAVEAAFATDGTGTINDFVSVRTDPDKSKWPRIKYARLAVDPIRPFRTKETAEELGFGNTSLEAGGDLCSIGTGITDGVTTTKDGISKLFEQILGGYRTGEGSAVASGSSANGVTVSAGDGAQFLAGQLIFVETGNATALYTATAVDVRSTDGLVFGVALPGDPGTSARVLNSQMVYETDKPVGTTQWLVEFTRDRDDIFLYMGCYGTLALEWPLGGKVRWSTTQQVTKVLHDDELAGAQGGSGLSSSYSFDSGTPVKALSNGVFFGPSASGTAARVTPTILELTIDLGISQTPIPSHNGVEGRAGYEMLAGAPMCTVTVLAGTETYKDAWAAGTVYRLLAQAGNTAGKMAAFYAPRLQIVDIEATEVAGLACEKITLKMLEASDYADQSTDVLRARYYLGRG